MQHYELQHYERKYLMLSYSSIAYSTQDCFKEAWSSHKSVHIKLDALTLQQTPEGWQYCLKKGRTRTSQLPRFDWTGYVTMYLHFLFVEPTNHASVS